MRADKEEWIDGMMKGMEEDMKRKIGGQNRT